jgi:hypothetical protein
MLRILIAVTVIAAAVWGTYWFIGSRALDRTVTQILAEHPDFAAESHHVRGFPNRFDLTLTEPRLQMDPLRWQAPFLQVFALSYRPHHLIVILPHEQRASVAGQEATLLSDDARASLFMTPDRMLPLERTALVVQAPRLQMQGATHQADALRMASRSEDARLHDAVIEIEAAFPDPVLMDALDPERYFPRRFDVIRLEGQMQFDRPLDRAALAGAIPNLVIMQFTGARVRFDDIDVLARGTVEPDAAGRLSGPVTLTVTGWPSLLEKLSETGIIDADQAGFLRPLLAGMTDPENPDQIELELMLRDGAVSAGPITLARIPALF